MFDLFKRKNWQPEVLPEIKGTSNGLSVTLRNFPCRLDASSNTRTYRYSDFGTEFLSEINDRQLGEFKDIYPILTAGAVKTVLVRLRDLPPIEVSLSGRPDERKQQFYSDLADALIDAFEKQRIKP